MMYSCALTKPKDVAGLLVGLFSCGKISAAVSGTVEQGITELLDKLGDFTAAPLDVDLVRSMTFAASSLIVVSPTPPTLK